MGTTTSYSLVYTANFAAFAPPDYSGIPTAETYTNMVGQRGNFNVTEEKVEVVQNGVTVPATNYIVAGTVSAKGIRTGVELKVSMVYKYSQYCTNSTTPECNVSLKNIGINDLQSREIRYFQGYFSIGSISLLKIPSVVLQADILPISVPTSQVILYNPTLPNVTFRITNPTYDISMRSASVQSNVVFPVNTTTNSNNIPYKCEGSFSATVIPAVDGSGNLRANILTTTGFAPKTTISWSTNTANGNTGTAFPSVPYAGVFGIPVVK